MIARILLDVNQFKTKCISHAYITELALSVFKLKWFLTILKGFLTILTFQSLPARPIIRLQLLLVNFIAINDFRF